MRQKQITTIARGINAASIALKAAQDIGEQVGLKTSTATVIERDLKALLTANHNYGEAKIVMDQCKTTGREALTAVVAFVTVCRNVLKARFGNSYNRDNAALWGRVGFDGSIRIPRSVETLSYVIHQQETFLAAHPEMQNTDLKVTAANAKKLLEDLNAARSAMAAQETALGTLKGERDKKFTALVKRMSYLFKELSTLIDPMSVYWDRFGFKLPGAKQTPEPPQEVKVVQIRPDAVELQWPRSARAEHYRVWQKIEGLDEDFVAIGRPSDCDFTVEPLPPNATVHLAVSAVNAGGESARSAVLVVNTGAPKSQDPDNPVLEFEI